MHTELQSVKRLAQSASALGAGILGFGLGAKWGGVLGIYSLIVIITGAVLHLYGMYVMQMKQPSERTGPVAKALWISAWICLLALIGIVIFLIAKQR
jgi:NADH:ubiquinone oxidoreductase subunit 6 (subunit J)